MAKYRFEHGNEAIKAAKKKKCEIRPAKGDHMMVVAPDGTSSMTVPVKSLGKGLGCKIWKWFKLVGIISILVYVYLQINYLI